MRGGATLALPLLAAVAEDIDKLWMAFRARDSLRYDVFVEVFRELRFAHIFLGRRSPAELLGFSEQLLMLAVNATECRKVSALDSRASWPISPKFIRERVFGIYLLYTLFFVQPPLYRARIRIVKEQVDSLLEFLNLEVVEVLIEDARQLVAKLVRVDAFRIVKFKEDFDRLEYHEYEQGHTMSTQYFFGKDVFNPWEDLRNSGLLEQATMAYDKYVELSKEFRSGEGKDGHLLFYVEQFGKSPLAIYNELNEEYKSALAKTSKERKFMIDEAEKAKEMKAKVKKEKGAMKKVKSVTKRSKLFEPFEPKKEQTMRRSRSDEDIGLIFLEEFNEVRRERLTREEFEKLQAESAAFLRATLGSPTTLVLPTSNDSLEDTKMVIVEKQKTPDRKRQAEKPKAPDGKRPAKNPKAPEGKRPTEKPKVLEGKHPAEKPKTPDRKRSAEKPEAPHGKRPVKKPKAPEGKRPTEKLKVLDGKHPVEKPKTPDRKRSAEKPEALDGKRPAKKPKVLDGKHPTEKLKTPGRKRSVEKLKTSDRKRPAEKPKTPDRKRPAEKPKTPDRKRPAEKPKTPDRKRPVEQPKTPDRKRPVEKPKTPDRKRPVEKPKTPDRKRPAEKPKTPDRKRSAVKPKALDGKCPAKKPKVLDGKHPTEKIKTPDGKRPAEKLKKPGDSGLRRSRRLAAAQTHTLPSK